MKSEYNIPKLLVIFLIIALGVLLVMRHVSLSMKEGMKSDPFKPRFGSLSDSDNSLRDFYIFSSYNTCCEGDFQNGTVSIKQLESVIADGARVLDFGVYTVDGKGVIAAGSTDEITSKGTYNSLPINSVLSSIARNAFTASRCPNSGDPLILHFRIKTKQGGTLDELASAIKNKLGGRLLGKELSGDQGRNNISRHPIKEFMGKVIIIVDSIDSAWRKNTNLAPLVNIESIGDTGMFFRSERYNNLIHTPNPENTRKYNKSNLTMVLPDYGPKPKNYALPLGFNLGCQMNCLSFQSKDNYLQYAFKYFNDNGSAFVLKPEVLRYVPIPVKKPEPQNKDYSYAKRTISKPYFEFSV